MSDSKHTIYGSLTALDREDVTRVLWTRTGEWTQASEVEREIEHLRQQRDELLAALRNALPVLEFEVETRGSNDLLYEIPAGPVLDAARAAIAKAEGRADG
jgi:hypothetical protein